MSYLVRLCTLALLLSQSLAAHAEPYNLGAFRLAPIDDPWRIEFQPGERPRDCRVRHVPLGFATATEQGYTGEPGSS